MKHAVRKLQQLMGKITSYRIYLFFKGFTSRGIHKNQHQNFDKVVQNKRKEMFWGGGRETEVHINQGHLREQQIVIYMQSNKIHNVV